MLEPTPPPPAAPISHPFGSTLPLPGESIEVAPGVRWIRMAMPFALDHINLWLLRDRLEGEHGIEEGWTIIDCCSTTDQAKTWWEQIFATQLEGLPILRVIVTHHHADHAGLADWICQRWSRPHRRTMLWMNPLEHHHAMLATKEHSVFAGDAPAEFYARHGLTDAATLRQIRERLDYYTRFVPSLPRAYVRLVDGMRLRIGGHDWICISGHGHSPDHIALHCPDLQLLISGDMVLPKWTAFIGVVDIEPESDPFTLYFESLRKFGHLPAETLVLPSHGTPFVGLHPRIEQMQDRHQRHLTDALTACRQSARSAFEIMKLLSTKQQDLDQTLCSMSEAIAHLHQLRSQGLVQRVTGDDGEYRFQAVPHEAVENRTGRTKEAKTARPTGADAVSLRAGLSNL